MERSRGEAWSPLATVEEIQRRLIRPSYLLSPPLTSFRNDVRSREDLQTKKEAKVREMENKKLEDYLDPALLSAVSSKIGRQKKDGEMKKLKREIQKFQWPVDELKVFVNDSRMEKTMDWSSDEVVDLKDDNGID
ncbi:uncharacterized protein LOC104880171 [Vitis vinifera]|nr:uncharacterized protein LOC104880171 [Vitis vinifera]|eukprot:XP_010654292.1 PREDICTED: uncharacterized protein LOC104880171 [Vitis vinifera]